MVNIKNIGKEFDNLPVGWIVMLETKAEKALDVNTSVVKTLTLKNYNGIILTASRPYNNMINIYNQNNINTKKLFFLDCISKGQDSTIKDTNNVKYIENVSSLTSIALLIHESINNIKGNKFVFIDSITTMLIHNSPDSFARFIHSILTRMRLYGVNGLLISISGEINKEVRAEIAQLCDKVISVE